MTEAMNFFQSIFMFKSFTPISISKAEIELAISLKSEARKLAAIADEEMLNGQKAQVLAFEAADKDKTRIFAEIAVWHHNRAQEKYRKSAARFEEAGKIQTAKRKAFNSMSKEMTRRGAEAESAVNFLNDFLKQNEEK